MNKQIRNIFVILFTLMFISLVSATTSDLQFNGSLSIIKISNASYFDNKGQETNIYSALANLDNIWSNEIVSGESIKVKFENNLNYLNDITVYPRIVEGSPKIEIYSHNTKQKVAEFDGLIYNEYNKVYLTNLTGNIDTFDLVVSNGTIIFDQIIDPSANDLSNRIYQC